MVRKTAPLSLYIPEPKWRPGDPVDFRGMRIPAAGTAPVAATIVATTVERRDQRRARSFISRISLEGDLLDPAKLGRVARIGAPSG